MNIRHASRQRAADVPRAAPSSEPATSHSLRPAVAHTASKPVQQQAVVHAHSGTAPFDDAATLPTEALMEDSAQEPDLQSGTADHNGQQEQSAAAPVAASNAASAGGSNRSSSAQQSGQDYRPGLKQAGTEGRQHHADSPSAEAIPAAQLSDAQQHQKADRQEHQEASGSPGAMATASELRNSPTSGCGSHSAFCLSSGSVERALTRQQTASNAVGVSTSCRNTAVLSGAAATPGINSSAHRSAVLSSAAAMPGVNSSAHRPAAPSSAAAELRDSSRGQRANASSSAATVPGDSSSAQRESASSSAAATPWDNSTVHRPAVLSSAAAMPWDNSTAQSSAAIDSHRGASSSARSLGVGSSDSLQRSTMSQTQATDAQQADAGQDVASRPARAKPKSGMGRGSKQTKSKGPTQEASCLL